MRVLISGASVAGPVLAYWLKRYGFHPTVVERAPTLRKTGGHAVDLFRPSMAIVERMGLLDRVEANKTGTERTTLLREGARPVHIDTHRALGVTSDGHAEIMRDDLSEILYDATRDDVEYVFGDSITSIDDDPGEDEVRVTFERAGPRVFDLVIGADGLHSTVRRLVFGDEHRFTAYLGGYVSVLTVPNHLGLSDRTITLSAPGRLAAVYSSRHMDDARALFMFRSPYRLDFHYRDVRRQRELLREAYAGIGWEVPRLLAELDHTPAFYFDEITQLRMDTWSRGRISLVGDAAYCPGPAVGGSTSMAVIGAYVLAGELAAAGGDHVRALRAYEAEMADYVRRSRTFAARMVKQVIPDTAAKLWLLSQVPRLLSVLPAGLAHALTGFAGTGAQIHDDVRLEDYPG